MKDIIDLLGRLILGFIFLLESYDTFHRYDIIIQQVSDAGFSKNAPFLINVGTCFLILGAILLIFGYRTKFGSLLILVYLIPVAIFQNQFWLESGEVRYQTVNDFLEILALVGALLILTVNEPGKYSVRKLFATTKVRESRLKINL